MKKLSLVLLGALATAQVAQAAPGAFNGLYLGGQLGWTQRSVKTTFPSLEWGGNIKDSAVNSAKKSNGLIYGLYGGYGQNNNGFYWGCELNVEHDTASRGSTHNVEVKQGDVVTKNLPTNLHTKYQRGVVFGIAPRVGAVIANENLIYVKLGMELSNDEVEFHHEYKTLDARGVVVPGSENSKKVSESKTQFVFIPGVGYERAFGKMLARIEYGYNFGAKIGSPNLVTNAVTKNTAANVKYSAHVLKVGLAYKF